MAATNQLENKVALVAGTRLVNFQTSAAIYLPADINYANQKSISLGIYDVEALKRKKIWQRRKREKCAMI